MTCFFLFKSCKYCSAINTLVMIAAVSCMALNTRLGCLDPNLRSDSDAQRMIAATNDTFDALNVTENNLPLWKIWPTPAFKQLVAAQDIFTECVFHLSHAYVESIL
jgi:hypothetical protein